MIFDLLTFPILIFFFPILFIVLAILTEASDRYGLSTFIVIVSALTLQLFSDIHPFTFIVNNVLETIFIVIGWFLVGSVYATVKWWIYVNKIARKIKIAKDSEKILYYADHRTDALGDIVPLQVSDYKGKITGWISFWLFSLLGTLLNDVLLEFAEWLYSQIGGILQKISNKAFSGL